MSGKRFLYMATTSMVVVGLLAGFVFLGNVFAYGKTIYTQLGVFSQVLSYINENYVDEVEGEELIDGAITGMLEELDPHSNYLSADRFKRMQERNRGTYYGIGISFDIVNGDLTVISPIEGSPSYELGIRAGDVIAEIEGESAKDITRQDVFDKLRGPRGTTAHVAIRRAGHDELMNFDIVRDEIPIFSVPYRFMLTDEIGYIRMTRFSATTSDELEDAIEALEKEGMKQIVLDLRGNTGGYLNEAIEVADMFLDAGRKIVYTRGRLPDSSEDYHSTGRGTRTEAPLIVMVDHGSASASEIVSGAIQDWDRGLIVGQTTFGKGLVQRQYRLKNGAALLLTVARYYTPSGRLIQRDYSDRDTYLSGDNFEDMDRQTMETGDEDASPDSTRQRFLTAAKRTVYGGGGIAPDIRIDIPYPTSPTLTDLNRDRAIFDFATQYVADHKIEKTSFEFREFLSDFEMGPEAMGEFTGFLEGREIEFHPDSLALHQDQVKRWVQAEIARNVWGENARYHVIIEADPELQEAITYLPEAKLLSHRLEDGEVGTPGPLEAAGVSQQ